ncbi:MAG: leucyl aminopeptidase family protein [Bacteriovoracaceae bacterium]|nr:leucyl aminopeptidase family protein [Bacteriovoracaceae bacterium]
MDISVHYNATEHATNDLVVLPAFTKKVTKGKKSTNEVVNSHWPKVVKENFNSIAASKHYKGNTGEHFILHVGDTTVLLWGMGEKSKLDNEAIRRSAANLFKHVKDHHDEVSFVIDSIVKGNKLPEMLEVFTESLLMTGYAYDKYMSKKATNKIKSWYFETKEKKSKAKACDKALAQAHIIGESVAFARDLVNDPPNHLDSVAYAKLIEKDVKSIKRVKYKHLGRAEMKKEKMNLFLSVNAASAHEARLVHLTYTPAKVTKNTKHICFVGKGLTFDTGGLSLKPSGSMVNMKFDMAGSATVYGAFRAAALQQPNVKITCILGMTDNAVSADATMPDSIVTGRNGMSVEILNTDAEGRLVLADCLDYACDLKPDCIIDSATLTGACLVALGTEVCGLMTNDSKLGAKIKKSADTVNEYVWELPIIDEWRNDMKSPIADLKNIGGTRFAGTPKAAAFLENFIKNDISWAHLDIAGVGDSSGHLPYCPKKGASGQMIRTLTHFATNS